MLYPHPVLLVGSYDIEGKPNIMTASWSGIVSSEPPCLSVSLRKQRHSYNAILSRKAFTISIPSEDMLSAADFAGVFSGSNVDKFKETGLSAVDSEVVDAPYVAEAPVVLLCKLVSTVELGSHTLFIGEIQQTLVEQDVLAENGLPCFEKVKPLCYDSGSSHYYSTGKRLSKAYITKKTIDRE